MDDPEQERSEDETERKLDRATTSLWHVITRNQQLLTQVANLMGANQALRQMVLEYRYQIAILIKLLIQVISERNELWKDRDDQPD